MKSAPSRLAPFFRSDTQGEILAALFTHDQDLTTADVATAARTSTPTAHRELRRLADSGVITARTVGRTVVFRPAVEHPLFRAVSDIIDYTYGPIPRIEQALSELDGIAEAFIFGSWAARRAGQAGPPPGDIDVLIVGRPDAELLDRSMSVVERSVGREVNVQRVSPEAWAAHDDDFTATVRSRPLFPLRVEPTHRE